MNACMEKPKMDMASEVVVVVTSKMSCSAKPPIKMKKKLGAMNFLFPDAM